MMDPALRSTIDARDRYQTERAKDWLSDETRRARIAYNQIIAINADRILELAQLAADTEQQNRAQGEQITRLNAELCEARKSAAAATKAEREIWEAACKAEANSAAAGARKAEAKGDTAAVAYLDAVYGAFDTFPALVETKRRLADG